MPRCGESSMMGGYSLATYTPSQMFTKHRPVDAGILVLAPLAELHVGCGSGKDRSLGKSNLLPRLRALLRAHPSRWDCASAPDVGWHTYWINPGDAGKAAKIKWDLPDGFEVSALEFPAPGFVPFGPAPVLWL